MGRTCGACRKSLSLKSFSKSQLRKWKLMARCKSCVSVKDCLRTKSSISGNFKLAARSVTEIARQLTKFSANTEPEERLNIKLTKRKRNLSEVNEDRKKAKKEQIIIQAGRVRRIRQLGDGNCLYRSMCHGLKDRKISHGALRQLLANWVLKNKNRKINGTEISKWIKWEKHCDIYRYCQMQRKSSYAWGGQVELCAFSHVFNYEVNVFQFERQLNCYKRVTSFVCPTKESDHTLNLLYVNKNHYDALEVT